MRGQMNNEVREVLAARRDEYRDAIFEICELVTGGREHLDVRQCISNIKAKLKEQSSE